MERNGNKETPRSYTVTLPVHDVKEWQSDPPYPKVLLVLSPRILLGRVKIHSTRTHFILQLLVQSVFNFNPFKVPYFKL